MELRERADLNIPALARTTDKEAAVERDHRFAIGADKVFEYPRPQLEQGIWDGGPAPSGQLFPETLLADGRHLEERLAGHFAVIGYPGALEAIDPRIRDVWNDLDVVVMDDPGFELIAALIDCNVEAVILRPDGYVFGLTEDTAALSKLTLQLAGMLRTSLR